MAGAHSRALPPDDLTRRSGTFEALELVQEWLEADEALTHAARSLVGEGGDADAQVARFDGFERKGADASSFGAFGVQCFGIGRMMP